MTYVDSRGAHMHSMAFSEALTRLAVLAESNLPDEHDVAREVALASERVWQMQAIDTVRALVDGIDGRFMPPSACRDWPVEVTRSNRGDDAEQPASALRIVLQMARNAMPDPMTMDLSVGLAEEFDLNGQALDLVEDLLGLHAGELDAAPVPPRIR